MGWPPRPFMATSKVTRGGSPRPPPPPPPFKPSETHRPAASIRAALLFLAADNGVLGPLGNPELQPRLSRDFNGFAGGGIASHPRFAVGFDEPPETWQNEYPVFLCFYEGGLCQLIQEHPCDLVVGAALFCHMPNQLRLRHSRCCHT